MWSAVMSLHKLTAGDGYTYLTRQVAAQDATHRGYAGLGDYYAQKGESPGVWLGRGLVGLTGPEFAALITRDLQVQAGAPVSEAQMKALFGHGQHPDAALIETELRAGGAVDQAVSAAVRLGLPFKVFDAATSYRARVAAALAEWNTSRGLPGDWPVPPGERSRVRTEVAAAMFAETYDRAPADARELSGFLARASRQPTTAVAGYDLTFSPVKSVSALWALAPLELARQIEQAHHDAVTDTLGWLEDHAAFTRSGHRSAQQIEVTGLIMAAFTHRDARSGDPDLHTHVAVSNKVQALDGRWLALDGRPLHKLTVAASERYNTRLEALLVRRLGLVFAERPATEPGKRPVREVVGVQARLLARWSQRRAAIDARRGELAAQFQRAHGRPPTTVEAIALAQQATLETRQHKHEPRSLAEQRAAWRAEASAALGSGGTAAMLHTVLHPRARPIPVVVSPDWISATARAVVETVQHERAVWQDNHVRAEAERVARAAVVADTQLDVVVDQVVAAAAGLSVRLDRAAPDDVVEPGVLRRRDGSSVYVTVSSQLYTSGAVLAAEQRLVAAAQRKGGARLDPGVVDVALVESAANGVTLNPGQAALVRDLATSGARVQLALAPAGTGKTTAMRVLARAWTGVHGRRGVLGLAPSAAAATVLRDELNDPATRAGRSGRASRAGRRSGVHADTLAKLLDAVAFGDRTGWLPDWIQTIGSRSLVVIDEAGMAATTDLDRAVAFLLGRGASVRLVGDDQQLAAIGAGGVLRDIAHHVGAAALSQVVRFAPTPVGRAEAAATLALREGDPAGLAFYLDHSRVQVGDLATATEQAYRAWAADRGQDRDAIMLAPTREIVAALNARARAERLAAQTEDTGPEVTLADGSRASRGEVLLARRNERRLRITRSDWVKNGDRFQVLAVHGNGALRVRHLPTGRALVLPARYVARHAELGYASTIHTAQGVTADTCHLVATGAETRQLLYVGLTRGRNGNHVYLVTVGEGDPHEVISRDALLPPTALDVLVRAVERDDAPVSATTAQRETGDPVGQLAEAAARYHDALGLAAADHLGPQRMTAIDTGAEQELPGLTGEPAWPTLRQALALRAVAGHDPIQQLRGAIGRRELVTANDKAAVLHWRLDMARRGAPDQPLPWLPATPTILTGHRVWGAYLSAVTAWITRAAHQLSDTARAWTPESAPAWAAGLVTLGHTDLVADLAVWRAAVRVEPGELDPAGPPQPALAEHRYRRQLLSRISTALGDQNGATGRWKALAHDVEPRVLADPYWPQLAARLDTAHRAGLDITSLARRVGLERPLPDQALAAAWWWRITGHLTTTPTAAHLSEPRAPAGDRPQPAWTDHLTQLLGETATAQVMTSPEWNALVATVESTAAEANCPPGDVLSGAIRPARGPSLTDTHGLRPDELATALIWRMSALAHEPALYEPPPDPHDPSEVADAEQAHDGPIPAPADLHRLGTTPSESESHTVDEDWLASLTPPSDNPDHDIVDGSKGPSDAAPTGADTVAKLEAVLAFDRYVPRTEDATRATTLWADPVQTRLADPSTPWSRAIRAGLVDINSAAVRYYQRAYPGSWAPAYLGERLGTDLSDQPRYPVGYAPPGRTHLVDNLRRYSFRDDDMIDAGLAARDRYDRVYDVFRDRLVFPIHDANGDVVGFIARANPARGDTAPDGRLIPKYLNTRTTAIFSKGEQLYGLTEAADLRTAGANVVRVEGPLDAIAVTLAGRGRYIGVAPLGTSLTNTQAAKLVNAARPTGGLIVATDPNTAGQNAARNDYWTLTAIGDTPRHAALPDGLDPADVLRHKGTGSLYAALDATRPLAEGLVAQRVSYYADRLDSIEGQLAAARSAATVVGALPPDHWNEQITQLLGLLGGSDGSRDHLLLEVLDAAHRWINDPGRVAHIQQTAQRRLDSGGITAMSADGRRSDQPSRSRSTPRSQRHQVEPTHHAPSYGTSTPRR